ncbi:MAG: RNA methyltransferase [Crocinitomicaceae bacterium]
MANKFVVEGEKLLDEMLREDSSLIDCIYYTENCSVSIPETVSSKAISEKELQRISGLKSPHHVLAVLHITEVDIVPGDQEGMLLLLDEVKDPGNLGTLLRTADWFGVQTIICSPTTVELYNPKVVQASMGAIFRVQVHYKALTTVIPELKSVGYEFFGADMEGENAFTIHFPKKSALIMGSESQGLSDQLKDLSTPITIPKVGKTESLNVAMAAGIILSRYAAQTLI